MSYSLHVGQYGHTMLKGVRHWAFLLMTSNLEARLFQITGSTTTYEWSPPKDVQPGKSQSFLGSTKVGLIEASRYDEFVQILESVPIVRNDLGWNCQNWIVNAMAKLEQHGFQVPAKTKTGIEAGFPRLT